MTTERLDVYVAVGVLVPRQAIDPAGAEKVVLDHVNEVGSLLLCEFEE